MNFQMFLKCKIKKKTGNSEIDEILHIHAR